MLWIDGDAAFGPPSPGFYQFDIREEFPISWTETFDYVVANHSLSDLTFHELPGALKELHRVLRPGGVLRVLVPHLLEAFAAWQHCNRSWFPQGPDLEEIDERFVTFVTWFGTVGSVFTPQYLYDLLKEAGFTIVYEVERDKTPSDFPEIVSLDGDRTTALIYEGRK